MSSTARTPSWPTARSEELARDGEFFDADAAIVTGQRTGDSAELDELATIATATTLPVMVGSGVNPDNVGGHLHGRRCRDRRELR